MAKLDSKNDLKVRAYFLSIQTIRFLEIVPEKRVYWTIGDQLLRSVTSIGANIVEAKSSASRKEFIKFYQISLKSANESKYWLGLLRDTTNMDKDLDNNILNEVVEVANMLGSSIITMKNKKF